MTALRWILGVTAALLAAGSAIAFVVFIVADVPEWLKRARNWRRLTVAVVMLWFNIEVWRRVLLVLINW